jgi:VanZ family protein
VTAPSPFRTGHPVSLWAPVALLMAIVFVLSDQPSLPAGPFPGADKWAHAITYASLAAVWLRALAGGRWEGVTVRRAVCAAAAAVAYGVTDEWHQSFVPGRSADAVDLVADAVGAGLAAGALGAWGIMLRRRRARHAR